jgi:hypothetical protein
MTPRQQGMYWREWGRCREYFRNKGLTSAECDAKRHEPHRRALGHEKSSKSFCNADLDKVIAAFRAVWDDANFDAQMRQREQPDRRREDMVNRCWDAARVCMGGDPAPDTIMAYLDGTAHKIFKVEFSALDERRLGVVMGILEKQEDRVRERDIKQVEKMEEEPF